jgi:hypothetical protein
MTDLNDFVAADYAALCEGCGSLFDEDLLDEFGYCEDCAETQEEDSDD